MPKQTHIQFRTDGNFAIHVTDIQKAEEFYTHVLGFKLTGKTSDRLDYNTGSVRLFVVKDDHVISFIPALEVQDYDEAKAHLLQNGCTIIKEFDSHSAFYFTDPFGIVIDVIERRK
jgi:catechol 2,3-dioxygenase-like lactoylglutathione lyase family enzyme